MSDDRSERAPGIDAAPEEDPADAAPNLSLSLLDISLDFAAWAPGMAAALDEDADAAPKLDEDVAPNFSLSLLLISDDFAEWAPGVLSAPADAEDPLLDPNFTRSACDMSLFDML